jgi:hypothetical protein
MSQTKTTAEKMIDLIGFSSAAMEKAAGVMATKEAQEAKVAALIPAAVEALVQNERILPHQKEAAAEALKDPVRALELITKLAGHRNTAEVNQLGTPVSRDGQQKQASHDPSRSLTTPHVGARSSGHVKQSDVAIWRGLGLPVPTA